VPDNRKILILKLGAIGDVIMALSLLTAIDERYPGAEITWICGKTVEPILKSLNRINQLITVDENDFYKGPLVRKIISVAGVWKRLLGKKFNVVLNCYKDPRYNFLLPVRSEVYLDFSGRSRMNSFIPGRYHSDEYARLITGINDWSLRSSVLPRITKKIPVPELPDGSDSQRVILAPGGTRNIVRNDDLRRWPIENYKALAEKLIDLGNTPVIIGADSDNWVSEAFSGIKVTDLVGKTTLLDLVSLFRLSRLLVTHDTGTLHLAKLSGIKIIALFGPVNPKERIGINENIEIIWGGTELPCSPCYNGKEFAKCANNVCMKNISVQSVLDKIADLSS